jgi:hypothetical protein
MVCVLRLGAHLTRRRRPTLFLAKQYTLQMLDQDLLMEVHDAAAPLYPPKATAAH